MLLLMMRFWLYVLIFQGIMNWSMCCFPSNSSPFDVCQAAMHSSSVGVLKLCVWTKPCPLRLSSNVLHLKNHEKQKLQILYCFFCFSSFSLFSSIYRLFHMRWFLWMWLCSQDRSATRSASSGSLSSLSREEMQENLGGLWGLRQFELSLRWVYVLARAGACLFFCIQVWHLCTSCCQPDVPLIAKETQGIPDHQKNGWFCWWYRQPITLKAPPDVKAATQENMLCAGIEPDAQAYWERP